MSNDDLLTHRDGAVLTVTLNRPEKFNALTFSMYRRLHEVVTTLPADGSVRAMIITGAGEKAFAAGTDISEFRAFSSPKDGLDYESRVDTILTAIEACPVPLIAAISGACTGGGAAIAACCDIRIASRSLKYGFPIARTLGNCLSAASLARLVALIGQPKVVDLVFTSRLMLADEAKGCGLVGELHDDHASVMARARSLAAEISGYAPLTLSTTKALLRRMRQAMPKVDDHDLVAKVYTSADFREGLEAFLAKRPPRWSGR